MPLISKESTQTDGIRKRAGGRWLHYILAFLIPFLIITLALLALHITPFGKHSLAITDGKYYLNSEMFFSRLIRLDENVLYSLNNGLGGNEWSQLAWGGFSLGNLLSLFATLETIPSVFTWICVVNLSLCGLTMYILLAHLNGHSVGSLIFSTSYALIGFNVVNCYQIGFVQGPQLLPLVILGLILLLCRKNPLLYILSLAVCAFSNFYFAFHLCVASVFFMIAYFYVKSDDLKGRRKPLFFRWAIASIIGGLLAAPMWLPALKAYSGGGRLNQTSLSEYSFKENMPFIQIFSKLFTGANSTNELAIGLPNIFCGILVVALVILFFMNRQIAVREKLATGVVIGVYLISFFIPAITLLMHGGTHTNWFPYRYSYVFSFILIGIAVEEFRYIGTLTIKETKRCGWILIIAALIIFNTSYEYISGGDVLLDFVLLIFMGLGFWFYIKRPDKAPLRTFSMLLLILVGINLYANIILSTKKVQDWELDLDEYRNNIMVSGALVQALNQSEDGFFRMEKEDSESGSVAADSYLYDYNGVSHSGPAERTFVHEKLNRLGINWFDMRHWYAKGVPGATDSLLGLKYIISKRDLTEEKGYEHKVALNGYSIYQNPDALSASILSNSVIEDIELNDNVFRNLNAVWKAMTGEERDIFTEQEDVTYTLFNDYANQSVTSKELQESFSASEEETEDGNESDDEEGTASYILYSFKAQKDGSIYVFDTSIPDSGNGLTSPSIRYVGTYRKGDNVEGKFPVSAEIGSGELLRGYCVNQVFAYADNEILAEYAQKLNERDISFHVVHENDLTGAFTAKEGQRILFTLPWDEGWTCYIDGEKADIDKTWDLFMSVQVPEGEHTYEMRFFPAWLNYGIFMCIAAFAVMIVFLIVDRRKKPLIAKKSESEEASVEESNIIVEASVE